jgi:hypothetical protein
MCPECALLASSLTFKRQLTLFDQRPKLLFVTVRLRQLQPDGVPSKATDHTQ